MSTLARIAANVKNAQLSTGPRSTEGKRIASLNATTHGMTSTQIVLPHESQAEYESVCKGFLRTWAPATDLEIALVNAVAATWWRLQRQRRIETALMQQRMKAVCETNPDLDGDTALAFLMTDPAEMKRMTLMLRYVNSAERAHAKAIAELRQVQKLRREVEKTCESDVAAALDEQIETFMAAHIGAEQNEPTPSATLAFCPSTISPDRAAVAPAR